MLADNNSTPNVGTTIETMIHTNVGGKVGICNICHKCGNLLGNSIRRVGLEDMSSVVNGNNAVLCATEDRRCTAPTNVRETTSFYEDVNMDNIIMVNNSNSFENTHYLAGTNVGYVNIPNAVSGSVTYSRCAINFSATVGATVRVISHVHSATRSRSHYSMIRIVNEHYNSVTLRANVTANTATVLIPRIRCGVRESMVTEVVGARGANGGRFVIIITRNINNMESLTGCIRRHLNVRTETAVLNRMRHNNSPALHSEIITDRVNFGTIRLLRRGVNGEIITVRSNGVVSLSVGRTLSVPHIFSRRLCGVTVAVSV